MLAAQNMAAHGQPRKVEDLDKHTLLGFTQPESLNVWPILGTDGEPCRIEPGIRSSSGETLRQFALDGAGVVCLSDFMTAQDREAGRLVQVLARQTLEVEQPIHAVYYRNTAISSRIASFVDYLIEALGGGGNDAPGGARRRRGWSRARRRPGRRGGLRPVRFGVRSGVPYSGTPSGGGYASSDQDIPSRASSADEAAGLNVPAVYRRGRSPSCFQPSRIGSTHDHAASSRRGA